MVVSKNGKKYHGEYIIYFFEELQKKGRIPKLKQFQVVQLSYTEFIVRVVVDGIFPDSAKTEIRNIFQKNLGEDILLKFELVDSIPREKSGKLRVVVGL